MVTEEFERAVTLGLGRAILHLHEGDAPSYRRIILDACLHNKAYDPQIEGSRAEYALDLMRGSGEPDFYANEIINSLAQEAGDWHSPHRFRVARLLAQSGNQSARQAMRSALQTRRVPGSDIAAEFVELDGIDGLLFVFREIGEQLAQHAREWEDDSLRSVADEICGRETVQVALENAAKTDSNVRAYLAAGVASQTKIAQRRRPDPKTLTYDEVRSLIESNNSGGLLVQWGQTASDLDIERAARDLVQETDSKKLRLYLLLFRKRPFPLKYEHLFRLAALPDGPIPRHALGVLANLQHEQIRSLAFSFIMERSSLRDYAIDLLVNNFRDGDHATVEGWCDAERDLGTINAFDRSLRPFFAAHPNPECEVRLLQKFYEREPCAHCRYFVIERLLELDGLTDILRRECKHDSYLETRALLKTH